MATADDDTQTAPAPDTAPTATPDMLGQALQLAQQYGLMPQAPQRDTTPTKRSWTSLLGEALGGGPPVSGMTDAEREIAGHRALGDFGTSLMAASQYRPGQTLFSNLGAGFAGAQRGEIGSEELAMAQLGAQQQWTQQQAQNRVEAIKAALPFLRLQAAQGIPNPLAGGGGGGPNTSISAAAGQPLTGDKTKDLPIIAARESGGDPKALNYVAQADPTAYARGATASGKYQIVNSTWQEGMKLAGLDAGQYATARDAPEAVQDKVASALYDKYGTKPWDPTQWKSNWVKDLQTGKYALQAGAPYAPPPGAPKAAPVPPASYKEASLGVTPPPSSGAPAAPASAGLPVPPIPPAPSTGVVSPGELPGAGTGAAGPPASTTTPPAQPAPQGTTQADQPPAPPPVSMPTPGSMSFEDWQKLHPGTAGLVTADSHALASAKQEQAAAAIALQQATAYGDIAGMSKANQAHIAASENVAKLQQEAQSKSIDTQRQLYNDEMQRQQQAQLKAQELAQTVAENEKQRQAQIKMEQIKAGVSFHQQIAEQSAMAAQDNTIKPMAAAAMKAHQMNLGLSQMLPILQDLPPSGGALGTVLEAHPNLAPMFNAAGILNDRQADAVRLINGLVSNISTEMKPTGLGALREYEWDAFKAQLPSMLSTPAGQQKAVAMLMNMNNRIQNEASWMNNYYNRKVPDETATTPGVMRPAHDLDTEGNESVQQRMDRELGPIVPSYSGPASGAGQAQWEQSLPPGKPYYKTWAVPDPKNPGQPLRDQNGNVRTTKTLEVRPW